MIDNLSYLLNYENSGSFESKMYYNKEERLMRESIPVELSGSRSEDALVSNTTTEKEAKMEMRDYFRNRQFILETLSSREAKIFIMYYGIDGQKPMTYEQVGEKLGVTRSRIGQVIAKIQRKLRHPTSVRKYMFLTDKDLGYASQKINDYGDYYDDDKVMYDEKYERLSKLIEEKLNAKKQARFDALSTEERKANELLNNLLQVRLDAFVKTMNIDVDGQKLNELGYVVGDVLSLSKSALIQEGFNELVEKIESLGLHFYKEFEYLEDFNKECYKSMIKFGLKDIEQLLSAPTMGKTAADLEIPIEALDMSVRSFNCLKRAGVDTVGDIVVMSTSQLAQVRNMGRLSCKEVIGLVRSIGYEIRPESIEPERWLDILVKDDVNIENVKKLNEDKEILRLSDDVNEVLKESGKYFINDLVSMTSAHYAEIGLTEQDVKVIDSRLKALGLGICPNGVEPQKWIKKFIEKPLDAKPTENYEELNINEIPRM